MLNPLLLLFLPLALVPIALHLITLYRTRTVELSTYRFLMDSYVRQRQRIRLLEYLVMLLRFLFVLLIVLALSRPVIERFGWLFSGQGGKDVTLIVDASGTMNAQSGGQTSMQRAQEAALAILDRLSASDHVTIIAMTDRPRIAASAYAGQKDALSGAIRDMQTTAAGANLDGALKQILEIPPRGPRSVYVITDGQVQTLRGLDDSQTLPAMDPATQLVVVQVAPTEVLHNRGIIGQPPQSLRPMVGLPVHLTATVVNHHPTEATSIPLTVTIDDQQVRQINLDLEPGETVNQNISYTPKQAGMLEGRFEISQDSFPDDDQFDFVLNVQPRMKVILVTDQDHTGELPDDFYVRAALRSPLAVESAMMDQEQQLARAMDLQRISKSRLTSQMVDACDVVVLLNVNVTDKLADMLKPFVQQGGGLLILPGERSEADGYQSRLLDPLARLSGLSYRLAMDEPVGDPNDETSFVSIQDVDLTHPVLNVFSQAEEREDPHFTQSRISRFFPLSVKAFAHGDLMNNANAGLQRPRVLLGLSNGQSALIEMAVGRGRVMVAGFAPTPTWSNIPLQPEFVPMLLRAMMHLRPPADVMLSASVAPGTPVTIQIVDLWQMPQVQATLPSEQTRLLDLHQENRQVVGALLDTEQIGIYRFNITAEKNQNPISETLGTAVNLTADQSQLQFLNEQEMVLSFAPLEPIYLSSSAEQTQLSEHFASREEIWRYLIWAVFLIIGVEFLIATLRVSVVETSESSRLNQQEGSRFKRWLNALGLLESVRGRIKLRHKETP